MFLAIGVLIASIPGYTSAVIPTGWPLLFVVMPILLLRCEIEWSQTHVWGAVFLAYAAISLLWAPNGLFAFMQLTALASVFLWAQTLPDLRKVSIGLAIGLGISALLSVAQFAGIATVYLGSTFPAGLFVNSNVFAEVSALVLVMLMVNRLWWWIPVCAPGLAIGSRASIIALLCVFLAWVWSRSKVIGALLTASLGALTAYSVTGFHNLSIDERLGIWRDTLDGLTLLGHGIGSFEYLYPYYAGRIDTLQSRPSFAHNDLLQLAFELGIGTIPLLIAFWHIARIKDNHRYVLICFGVIGLFGFPLYIPATAFMAACAAGIMVGRQRFVRAHGLDSRSIILGSVEESALFTRQSQARRQNIPV